MPRDGGGRGGRGRGRGRPSGPQSRDVQLSKKLSWLLRHGAEKEGLKLGQGGYVSLSAVLSNRNIAGLQASLAEVKDLVENNDKQRYSLIHNSSPITDSNAGAAAIANPDTDPDNYLIRANQGHSLKVDDEDLIKPLTLTSEGLPSMVVHGTRKEAWAKIVQSGGLKPMTRNHVHFATGLPKAFLAERRQRQAQVEADASMGGSEVKELSTNQDSNEVVSGMRTTSNILMFLDLQKALKSGISFGESNNGVILSKGTDAGLIPLDVFELVEERDGTVLLRNGVIV